MVNQQLIDYIKQSLAQGVGKETIKNTLLSKGWPAEEIESAFVMVGEELAFPKVVSTTLLSARDLLKETWNLFKQKIVVIVSIAAIPALILTLLLPLLQKFIVQKALYLGGSTLMLGIGLSMLIGLVSAIIQFLMLLALIYAIKDKCSVISAYQKAFGKIIPFCWIYLLSFAVVVGLPFPFLLVGLLVPSASVFAMILAALLIVVPGIIFFIWFIFGGFVLIVDHISGFNALMRSKTYVQGNVNAVFWRFFVAGFWISLVAFLIRIPLNLIFGASLSGFIFQFLSMAFATTFYYVFLFMLFNNLKAIRRENIKPESKKSYSFYLILAIMGIASLIIAPFQIYRLLLSSFKTTQDAMQEIKITSEIKIIKNGLLMYEAEYNKFPQSLDELFGKYPNLFNRKYIDPLTNKPYYYEVPAGGKNFKLCSGFGTAQEKCIDSTSP